MAQSTSSYMPIDGSSYLQDYQVNGIDYLYNLEPQQLNLFAVTSFYDPYASNSGQASETYAHTSGIIPDKMAYRINAVTGFKLPSLQIDDAAFDGSPLRMNFVTTGRDKTNTLKIKWVEDVYHTVRRYHMNWMNHWYNRYLDCMVCGQMGKFRNMILYMYHAVNLNNSTGAPVMVNKPIARFEFQGLVPETSGDISLDYGSAGNEELLEIDYKFNCLKLFYYPYDPNDKAFIGGMASEIQEGLTLKDVKNTAITGNTDWGGKREDILSGVKDGLHDKVYYI